MVERFPEPVVALWLVVQLLVAVQLSVEVEPVSHFAAEVAAAEVVAVLVAVVEQAVLAVAVELLVSAVRLPCRYS